VSSYLDRFYASLNRPIVDRSRVLLVIAVIPLALSFLLPLWQMHLKAPQYPQGLELLIYSYTVEGDLREVNTLNHYIGMHSIDQASLSDLDWIPFAIGALMLLTLRVAAIGDLRGLIDLAVMFAYFSVFSLFRFGYQLWVFGHNLDPKAPFDVEPFMPPLLGTAQIANFTTTSMPAGASYLIGVFALALVAAIVWNLRAARAP
jgi:copper chaperone NosL